MPRGRKSATSGAAGTTGGSSRARSGSVVSNASATSARSNRSAARSGRKSAAASTTASPATKASPAGGAVWPSAGVAGHTGTAAARNPPLPEERNPVLPANEVPVKLQIIQREASDAPNNAPSAQPKEIIIGRVKLPTVNGATHGFLLKRFDTEAVAASAMFKLAFPYATLEAEEREMAYLDSKYDCKAANGGTKTELVAVPQYTEDGKRKPGRARKELRTILPEGSTGVVLMGTWVPAADAAELAKEYGLEKYAQPLIRAKAAHFHGKPYFVDDKGKPIAQANGSPLEPAQLDALKKGLPLPPPASRTAPGVTTPHVSKVVTGSGASAGSASASNAAAAGSKRARVDSRIETDPATGAPRVSTTATEMIQHADGSRTMLTTKHNVGLSGRTDAEIQEDIAKSKAIAKQAQQDAAKQLAASGAAAGSKKRRAVAAPSAENDEMAEEEEYEDGNAGVARRTTAAVRRSLKRGTTVVRRRPIATGATALGVAGAVGAAAAAYAGMITPETVDLAYQAIQTGFANIQNWLF